MQITALAGGVGAAKFLRGLVSVVDPESVTIIGNTGDDANFHGLHVSPDLDIVTYTLAGLVDETVGWGIEGDTTHALEQVAKLGLKPWFKLGDRDLGTHLARTTWMSEGISLSEITERIRKALGVGSRIIPMSDSPVRTKILTTEGKEREFQEYFVKYGHREPVSQVWFEGAAEARPAAGVLEAIGEAERIIVSPSNPVISVGPILSVPGIEDALRQRKQDVYAISPIVKGFALRGPADRLLPVVGAEASASGVAALYADFCGTFVLDHRDVEETAKVTSLGMRAIVTETIMGTPEIAASLAKEILSA
jgi:LPPG:FO 2-phospho-L-lactate transferase